MLANDTDPQEFARRIRRHALRMVWKARASHIGSCLSIADVLAVLYARVMHIDPLQPEMAERDRLIMSKGHAAAVLYAALAERGYIRPQELEDYCADGSRLTGHISHGVAGVELSTGSLGHGLPVAAGMALAAKRSKSRARIFCILSDGECDEGSNWEAILFAPHHQLENLTAIVDYNKIQSFGEVQQVLNLEPFAEKWRTFGWDTVEVDGHDLSALERALSASPVNGKPRAFIAHTIKGRGVSFMEGKLEWHYKSPSEEQLAAALAEVG
jgi:transketolase